MKFSREWNSAYRHNVHLSIWPWSDLVSYVMRYARPKKKNFRVLELGCGAGANIPFFMHLKAEYFSVEGSEIIAKKNIIKFPHLKNNILVGDFTKEIPIPGRFDLVVDRASLTHNSKEGIKKCLRIVFSKLKPGGKYIGIDWFSTIHSDYQNGVMAEDPNTRTDIRNGRLAGVGRVHFSDKAHIIDLFSNFKMEIMEQKIIKREIPADGHVFASWNFVAGKEGR